MKNKDDKDEKFYIDMFNQMFFNFSVYTPVVKGERAPQDNLTPNEPKRA